MEGGEGREEISLCTIFEWVCYAPIPRHTHLLQLHGCGHSSVLVTPFLNSSKHHPLWSFTPYMGMTYLSVALGVHQADIGRAVMDGDGLQIGIRQYRCSTNYKWQTFTMNLVQTTPPTKVLCETPSPSSSPSKTIRLYCGSIAMYTYVQIAPLSTPVLPCPPLTFHTTMSPHDWCLLRNHDNTYRCCPTLTPEKPVSLVHNHLEACTQDTMEQHKPQYWLVSSNRDNP